MAGSPKALFDAEKMVGPEIDDRELLAYAAEKIDIVVTRFGHAVALSRDVRVKR